MEYQYRMLCPAPYSMESIQFKLSETHLSNCAILSPSKRPDSLTYTVSMETIQIPDSPLKLHCNNCLQVPSSGQIHFNQKFFSKNHEKYDICSQHPIVSIKLQELTQSDIDVKKNEHGQNYTNINQNTEQQSIPTQENKNMFRRKSILKIHNIEFQNQTQQSIQGMKCNENNQNKRRRSPRMGKILTTIHNQIKQKSKTITRTNSKSSRKVFSPTSVHEDKNRKSSPGRGLNSPVEEWESSSKIYQSLNDDSVKEKYTNPLKTQNNQNDEAPKGSLLAITNSSSGIVVSPEIKRRKSNYLDGKIKIYKQENKNEVYLTERPTQALTEGRKIAIKYKYLQQNKGKTIRQRIRNSIATKKFEELDPYIHCPRENTLLFEKNINNKLIQNRTSSKIISKSSHTDTMSKCLGFIVKKINLTDRNLVHNKLGQNKNKSISEYSGNSEVIIKKQSNNYVSEKAIKQEQQIFNAELDHNNIFLANQKKKGWRKNKQNYYKKLFEV